MCTVRRVAGLAWFQSESSLSRDATLSVARRCVTERRLELDQMVEQRINSEVLIRVLIEPAGLKHRSRVIVSPILEQP